MQLCLRRSTFLALSFAGLTVLPSVSAMATTGAAIAATKQQPIAHAAARPSPPIAKADLATTRPVDEVILGFEGTLVEPIPAKNVSLFDADRLLQLPENGATKNFLVYAGATQLLQMLVKMNIKVQIVSILPAETLKAFADQVEVDDGKIKLSARVKLTGGLAQSPGGNLDIDAVSTKAKVVFVSSQYLRAKEGQQGKELFMGKAYYAYPTFAASEAHKTADQAVNFAPDVDTWRSDQERLLLFALMLQDARLDSSLDLNALLAKDQQEQFEHVWSLGTKILEGTYKEKSYVLSSSGADKSAVADSDPADAQSVIHLADTCELETTRTGEKTTLPSIQPCLSSMTLIKKLHFSKDDSLLGCYLETPEGLAAQRLSAAACLNDDTAIEFLINFTNQKCAAYSHSLQYISEAPAQRCKDGYFASYNGNKMRWKHFPKQDSMSLEKIYLTTQIKCMTSKDGLDKLCARDVSRDDECQKIMNSNAVYGWDDKTCLNSTGKDLIPEILSLANSALLPAEVVSKYPANQVAKSLIYRDYQANVRPLVKEDDIAKPIYDVHHDIYPLMAFNAINLASILKDGFKNFHQVLHGNGCRCESRRDVEEDQLLNIRLDAAGADNTPTAPIQVVRPKYAYAMFYKTGPTISGGVYTGYGEVFAAFKPEVRLRTTFTPGDSLDHEMTAMPLYPTPKNQTLIRQSTYSETQIWGSLTKDDIEYLLVDCPFVPKSSANVIKLLQDAQLDIPVFSCNTIYSKYNKTPLMVPAAQLYGKPIKVRIPTESD